MVIIPSGRRSEPQSDLHQTSFSSEPATCDSWGPEGGLADILTLAHNKKTPLVRVGNGSDHLAQQVSCVAGRTIPMMLARIVRGSGIGRAVSGSCHKPYACSLPTTEAHCSSSHCKRILKFSRIRASAFFETYSGWCVAKITLAFSFAADQASPAPSSAHVNGSSRLARLG